MQVNDKERLDRIAELSRILDAQNRGKPQHDMKLVNECVTELETLNAHSWAGHYRTLLEQT